MVPKSSSVSLSPPEDDILIFYIRCLLIQPAKVEISREENPFWIIECSFDSTKNLPIGGN